MCFLELASQLLTLVSRTDSSFGCTAKWRLVAGGRCGRRDLFGSRICFICSVLDLCYLQSKWGLRLEGGCGMVVRILSSLEGMSHSPPGWRGGGPVSIQSTSRSGLGLREAIKTSPGPVDIKGIYKKNDFTEFLSITFFAQQVLTNYLKSENWFFLCITLKA